MNAPGATAVMIDVDVERTYPIKDYKPPVGRRAKGRRRFRLTPTRTMLIRMPQRRYRLTAGELIKPGPGDKLDLVKLQREPVDPDETPTEWTYVVIKAVPPLKGF